jgi:hypothetical protein
MPVVTAESLLEDVLEAGGSDNITIVIGGIVVGRSLPPRTGGALSRRAPRAARRGARR